MPILNPPHEDTGAFGDGVFRIELSDLWNYYTFPQGQALVRRGLAWTVEPSVATDTVDEYYLGGYRHEISVAKAAELTEAGFGEFITDDGGEGLNLGFGEGGFGEGGFGL